MVDVGRFREMFSKATVVEDGNNVTAIYRSGHGDDDGWFFQNLDTKLFSELLLECHEFSVSLDPGIVKFSFTDGGTTGSANVSFPLQKEKKIEPVQLTAKQKLESYLKYYIGVDPSNEEELRLAALKEFKATPHRGCERRRSVL